MMERGGCGELKREKSDGEDGSTKRCSEERRRVGNSRGSLEQNYRNGRPANEPSSPLLISGSLALTQAFKH